MFQTVIMLDASEIYSGTRTNDSVRSSNLQRWYGESSRIISYHEIKSIGAGEEASVHGMSPVLNGLPVFQLEIIRSRIQTARAGLVTNQQIKYGFPDDGLHMPIRCHLTGESHEREIINTLIL